MNGKIPECVDAERLAEYAELKLSTKERALVDVHLGQCRNCRDVLYETANFLHDQAAAKRENWFQAVMVAVVAIILLAVRFCSRG